MTNLYSLKYTIKPEYVPIIFINITDHHISDVLMIFDNIPSFIQYLESIYEINIDSLIQMYPNNISFVSNDKSYRIKFIYNYDYENFISIINK